MRITKFYFLFLIICSGCWVNKASIDPNSYASPDPACYWMADSIAEKMQVCHEEDPCLPSENYPLSLAEVLDIALCNNTQTKMTWAEARISAAEYGKSQSSAFPDIEAWGHFTHSRTSFLASQVDQPQNVAQEVLIVNDQSTWGPMMRLSYTLFDFGQRRYTSEAARYSLYFANYTHNREIQTIIEKVTRDYYSYLSEVKLLESKEADLGDALETLSAADLGFEKGVKNVSDVLQARTQVLLAEISLSEQKKSLNTSYAELLDDMGLPSTASLKTQKLPFIDPEHVHLACLDSFVDTALQCRPDYLAAQANILSAEKTLQASKVEYLPKVSYDLDFGRTYFSGGFHDDYDLKSVLRVSMPIFKGFSILNTIRKNEASLSYYKAQLKDTELTVIKEIMTSHYNVNVAFTTLKSANKLMKTAEEQYQVAMSQYKDGTNTILDLVSAQTTLFDARARQADAIREWFITLANLSYSAGIICNCPEDFL